MPEPDGDLPEHRPFNEMTFSVDIERLDDGVTAAIDALERKRDDLALDAAIVAYREQQTGARTLLRARESTGY